MITWFNTLLLAAMLLSGLFYGFTGLFPRFDSRLFRGVMIFSLGVFAPLIPPQFVLSAILVGLGVRMVWTEACRKKKTHGPENVSERDGIGNPQHRQREADAGWLLTDGQDHRTGLARRFRGAAGGLAKAVGQLNNGRPGGEGNPPDQHDPHRPGRGPGHPPGIGENRQ